jgi:hypothetical protein
MEEGKVTMELTQQEATDILFSRQKMARWKPILALISVFACMGVFLAASMRFSDWASLAVSLPLLAGALPAIFQAKEHGRRARQEAETLFHIKG